MADDLLDLIADAHDALAKLPAARVRHVLEVLPKVIDRLEQFANTGHEIGQIRVQLEKAGQEYRELVTHYRTTGVAAKAAEIDQLLRRLEEILR